MKASRKEFIRKAHKEACSEWKKNIEKEFPELFEVEWKVGDWFVSEPWYPSSDTNVYQISKISAGGYLHVVPDILNNAGVNTNQNPKEATKAADFDIARHYMRLADEYSKKQGIILTWEITKPHPNRPC